MNIIKGKGLFVGWPARLIVIGLLSQVFGTAYALNPLQLGPGGDLSDWWYDDASQTWMTGSNPFTLNAYANATKDDGGNGKYAWDDAGATDRYAYLIAAATPQSEQSAGDMFDISITGASSVYQGWGTPPDGDSNSVAGHGIYSTWYEIYEFQFDGPIGTIYDTQPGTDGSGQGYTESLGIEVNSLALAALNVHFDLITLTGDGRWIGSDGGIVNAFAPWSHDAQYVPVPAAIWLFGTALIGLVGFSKHRKAA